MAAPQVLVVDDEETIQHILRQLLERHGCEVRTAGSVEAAEPIIAEWEPEIALLDIILPGKNGIQLLQDIKQRYRDAEVMMMTSNSSADTAVAAMRSEAYEYLKKPFNLKEVWATVQRAIEKRGLTLKNREALKHHEERTQELSDAVSLPEEVDDLEPLSETLDYFLGIVTRELDADRGSLMLMASNDDALRIAVQTGISEVDPQAVRAPLDASVAGIVATTGQSLLVEDVASDPRPEIGSYPHLANSFISVPIVANAAIATDRRALGVINVTNRRDGQAFSAKDLTFVEGLARQVASSIESTRQTLKLQTAYESLKDAQEQLVFSERLKAVGQMAAGVGHDFNNALSVILNRVQFAFDELARENADLDKVRSHLATIRKTSLQGAEAIKRIQDYTRIRKDVTKGPVDLNATIRDAVEISRPKWKEQAEAGGAHIHVDSELGDVPRVAGNVYELTQVFGNLIFNAVEAMPQGGALSFRTFVEGDRVIAEVGDTGVGMDEETCKHLFEPFFTTKDYGQGLGTSILYGIVTRHGGNVTVTSRPGKGTTFRVELQAVEDQVGPAAEEQDASDSAFRPVSVLLVDDDDMVRETYEEALEAMGHQVCPAVSGAEAIALCGEREFDVVVTDLSMTGMSGLEVAAQVKQRKPNLPVVLFSGWALEEEADKVRSSGVDYVLMKPCMVDELLGTLQKAVRDTASA